MSCPLCDTVGGELLVEREHYRIIRAIEPDYPGFCRIIWRDHAAEMSDLSPAQQHELMAAVFAVERALRSLFKPDKINLASLGNMVSHVHWHVIARKKADRHFPQPVWAQPQREAADVWPQVSDESLRCAILQALGMTSSSSLPR